MKKVLKFLVIAVIIIIVQLFFLSNKSKADQIIDTDDYKPEEQTSDVFTSKAINVVSVATGIGSVVSAVSLIILAIKYMVGSVQDKAEYKKTMFPYLIGCIFIFSASSIVQVIYNITKRL